MDAMDPGISAAYEACRRLQLRHDPTYYWATRRLPADVRPATHALYGYVRTADQIVDGPHRPADRRRPAARRSTPGSRSCSAAAPAPAAPGRGRAGRRRRAPRPAARRARALHALDARRLRAGADRQRDELDGYMDGSAGSVGRIMAPLLGVPKRFHADFGRLGQAFQLTNFIRDVREDWEMDRIYLRRAVERPARAGRGARRRCCAPWSPSRSHGRALFALAEPAIAAAPASMRSGIRLAVAAYAADPRPRRGGRRRRARPPHRRARARRAGDAGARAGDDPPRDAARRRAHAARASAPTC